MSSSSSSSGESGMQINSENEEVAAIMSRTKKLREEVQQKLIADDIAARYPIVEVPAPIVDKVPAPIVEVPAPTVDPPADEVSDPPVDEVSDPTDLSLAEIVTVHTFAIKRGKTMLAVNGYGFNISRTNGLTDRTYWYCEERRNKKCAASVLTDNNNMFISFGISDIENHNHEPSPTVRAEIANARYEIKLKASVNTSAKPCQLIQESIAAHPNICYEVRFLFLFNFLTFRVSSVSARNK